MRRPQPARATACAMQTRNSLVVALFACAIAASVPSAMATPRRISADDFRLRYVPGFFVHGSRNSSASSSNAPYPPRMGLLDGVQWADLLQQAPSKDGTCAKQKATKLVLFLRHGEGIHNVATAQHGAAAWDSHVSKLPEYVDAPLTPLGVDQARDARCMLDHEVQHGGLQLDGVVVSPLDRTLDTYATAFANQQGTPAVVLELARETLGVAQCDRRKPRGPKQAAFPALDFGGVTDDADPWWRPDDRESDAQIDARARALLHHLFYERPEQAIAVVAHSGISRAALRVVGHPFYHPKNAEFVPLLLVEATTDDDDDAGPRACTAMDERPSR